MTNTWKNSYFRNPGLRVLYILSRAETDRILPLRIDPQPQEVVRSLVGRIEVFTDAEENQLLTQADAGNTFAHRSRPLCRAETSQAFAAIERA